MEKKVHRDSVDSIETVSRLKRVVVTDYDILPCRQSAYTAITTLTAMLRVSAKHQLEHCHGASKMCYVSCRRTSQQVESWIECH